MSAPVSPAAFQPLDPARDAEVAAWLGDARLATVAALRAEPDVDLIALTADGELVAAYALRRVKLMNELPLVVVTPGRRRQGFGRACLQDALRRSGKRPLVAEADEAARPFYLAVGFKLVGKRKDAAGTWRYRLGWHAPRPGHGATNSG
jgi:GNAT superfamily N-acetyltransferase